MIGRFSVIILLLSQVNGFFVSPQTSARKHSPLFSTEAGQQAIPIILNGQNLELTPALEEYVNKRIGGALQKLANSGSVRECDVVLSVSRNPKVRIVRLWMMVLTLSFRV